MTSVEKKGSTNMQILADKTSADNRSLHEMTRGIEGMKVSSKISLDTLFSDGIKQVVSFLPLKDFSSMYTSCKALHKEDFVLGITSGDVLLKVLQKKKADTAPLWTRLLEKNGPAVERFFHNPIAHKKQMKPSFMKKLARYFKSLKALHLSHTRIMNGSLASIESLRLQYLNLSHCVRISSLFALRAFPLQKLVVDNTAISGNSLQFIRTEHLVSLSLVNCSGIREIHLRQFLE